MFTWQRNLAGSRCGRGRTQERDIFHILNRLTRGWPSCRCRAPSREPKIAYFCQDGPPWGVEPRSMPRHYWRHYHHFVCFYVQMLSKCVIFDHFWRKRCQGSSSSGGRTPVRHKQKAYSGSPEGRTPTRHDGRQRLDGCPLEKRECAKNFTYVCIMCLHNFKNRDFRVLYMTGRGPVHYIPTILSK